VVAEINDPNFDCNANPQVWENNPGVYYAQCGSGAPVGSFGTANNLVGTWRHFVATVDSSQNSQIYTNGVLAGSENLSWPTTTQANFTFGKAGASLSPGQNAHVTIDTVRIYNRALSSNEVAMLYVGELAGAPVLTQDLTNFDVVYGHSVNLSVTAGGATPLSYQWYFVPTNNAGQAGAYAQTINDFVYGAVVTNGGFGYGNVPGVSFVGGGGSGAVGYGTVSNGVVTGIVVTNAGSGYTNLPSVVIDPPNGFLLGQTNSTLIVSNASQSSLGSYYVVVSNANGYVISSVVNLTLLYPPSITVEPSGFAAEELSSNSLSVAAEGTAPLSYQWFLNGTNLVGATNSDYAIFSLVLTNAGAYTVEVSNPYGVADSSAANVYVAPTLATPFAGAIGVWGQNTVLNVGAVGSGLLDYQWYFNGAAIPGATGSSYTLGDIQFTNAGLYSVVVSSAYGSVTNTAYQVVVNPANIQLGICPMVYLTGTAGYTYTIQSSTDLTDTNSWVTVTNLTIPYTPYIWADTATDTSKPANPRKYYRVLADQ
jgi:hypothetical protein